MLRESSYVGMIALGMSFVIIGGGIDLSAGGIVCLSGVICSRLGVITAIPGFVIVIACLAVGALCGSINAYIHCKMHLSTFVTTLASGFVFSGFALIVAFRESGRLVTQAITNRSFLNLSGTIINIHIMTLVWIALMAITMFILYKTRFGLHTYAQGSNPKSAQMSGVNTQLIKASGFVISGFFCGLAAAFAISWQGASSLTLGTGMEFQAIAACVVGGLVFNGGKGDTFGALVGSVFLTLIMNGIYKYGLSTAYQVLLQGAIIILATAFDVQFSRLSEKRLSGASR